MLERERERKRETKRACNWKPSEDNRNISYIRYRSYNTVVSGTGKEISMDVWKMNIRELILMLKERRFLGCFNKDILFSLDQIELSAYCITVESTCCC